MVRPYVPRFLREGDAAELKVVVNNASDGGLSGRVALEILDPDDEREPARRSSASRRSAATRRSRPPRAAART